MTDQALSVRSLSRNAMDHALALTLPHAGQEERLVLLATALCVDVVPAALATGLADAASLLDDPLVRGQFRALLHGMIARMSGNEGVALLAGIEKELGSILPGLGAMPAGEWGGTPASIPAVPRATRPHWRRTDPKGEVPDDADVAVDRYIMDDPEGLPVGARYVPGSLRVRELGTGSTAMGRWVSLSARMLGANGIEVERRDEVPSPASRSFRGANGPMVARLTVTPEGFPCVELAQPLAPPREVPVDVVAEETPVPAPAQRTVGFNFLPPDLVAGGAPSPRPSDADVARQVDDILGAAAVPAPPSED